VSAVPIRSEARPRECNVHGCHSRLKGGAAGVSVSIARPRAFERDRTDTATPPGLDDEIRVRANEAREREAVTGERKATRLALGVVVLAYLFSGAAAQRT
jgi:hypothetical protein